MSWTKAFALGSEELPTYTWRRITQKLSWFNNFRHHDDYDYSEFLERCSRDEAQIVSSKVMDPLRFRVVDEPPRPAKHKILLDLDMDAVLVPSSTPGHWHLYIDHEIEWPVYERLLSALAEAGVIEDGYAAASIRRRCTHLRVPWLQKLPTETKKEGYR